MRVAALLHRIAFKIILTTVAVGVHAYPLGRGRVLNFARSLLEPGILRLGMYLAFSRIRALADKPYTGTYTIHTLLRHEDVCRYVICIHSYLRFAPERPRIIVYDDGSLTEQDTHVLRRIPRCSVVSDTWITQHFYTEFGNNPTLALYRDCMKTTRKIIDLVFLRDDAGKTLLLDSDVGFFAPPEKLLSYVRSSASTTKIMHLSDVQDAYVCSTVALSRMFRVQPVHRVNTGILCFDTPVLTKRFVMQFFRRIGTYLSQPDYSYIWTEQTPWALLARTFKSERFPVSYHMGLSDTPDGAVCRHYVQTVRGYFIKDLLRFI